MLSISQPLMLHRKWRWTLARRGGACCQGHHIAFDHTASLEQLYVDVRLVAKFKDVHQSLFCSGILAELPN